MGAGRSIQKEVRRTKQTEKLGTAVSAASGLLGLGEVHDRRSTEEDLCSFPF